ncbi:exodeoxyribonuclease VII large subunit [Sphingomonas morindae]|uniref:Exodeoxyribonuclease 7 large subunit n=1 Tax=Sphingomonas morindae TaxID=1541170 RepID=A0ABY4X8U7_9SPHN|nr:exodeoxyribonuclease VII large subunit [Sphingomonas morindae]USI73328.1 exodeoxyribonuclease VII large subunit [Sphingomonas morindae]
MATPFDSVSGGLLADAAPGDNSPALSVSELSGALKRTVEDRFGHVRVRGEISGFKRHVSGHCYLTLKDDKACIDGVVWKGQAAGLRFRPEDGAEVIATGRLTTYPGRSKYQIVIERMELAGQGALMALLDKRRRQLAAEGLFDEARKRPLPFLPGVIGVITSPTGAVIRDILHRLADRFPSRVLVWPVPVQGEGAAERVAAAIAGFDALAPGGAVPRPDLLIVARGGGSIEDLWAFNEEVVVRAVAACRIPLISAVGHETDTSLCDFAADRRAPTPTAAAEMAVPVRGELLALVGTLGQRATGCTRRGADRAGERFQAVARRLPRADALLAPQRQRFDDAADRLPRALARLLAEARGDLAHAAGALRPGLLTTRLARERVRLDGAGRDLVRAAGQPLDRARRRLDQARLRPPLVQAMLAREAMRLTRLGRDLDRAAARPLDQARRRLGEARLRPALVAVPLARQQARLEALWRIAESLNPDRVLARGYARVEQGGKLVSSASAARAAAALELVFADGRVTVRPEAGASPPAPAPEPAAAPRRAKGDASLQPRLL